MGDRDNNVIDLNLRRSQRVSTTSEVVSPSGPTPEASNLLDMTQRRLDVLRQDRRRAKRTILAEFVGAFVVVPNRGLARVALYDLSDDGLAFDLELGQGEFRIGEEVAMRVYLQQTSYFPFSVRISNARTIPEEGVHRFGASLVKGTLNDEALHHFVKFIESVALSLKKDSGDVVVSGLSR